MYSKDRKESNGVKVTLHVHESLTLAPCNELNGTDFGESIWSTVKMNRY